MSKRKKHLVLLAVLLPLWAWILWNQFAGREAQSDARRTPAPGDAAAIAPGSVEPTVVHARTRTDTPEPPDPDILAAQRQCAALPLGRDPFFPPPDETADTSRRLPREAPHGAAEASPASGAPVPASEPSHPAPRLTATFLGGGRRSASLDGRLLKEGDAFSPTLRLAEIGDGYVIMEDEQARPVRVELARPASAAVGRHADRTPAE